MLIRLRQSGQTVMLRIRFKKSVWLFRELRRNQAMVFYCPIITDFKDENTLT